MKRSWVVLLCLCAVSLLGAQTAYGFSNGYSITNNSGAARSDLHFSIVGTGQMASLAVVESPPGCPAPTVTQLGSSGWTIDWGVACVDPGEVVKVTVFTYWGPAGNVFSSATWTPGNIPIPSGDVSVVPPPVPGASTAVLVLLVWSLAVAGVWMMRRRAAMSA